MQPPFLSRPHVITSLCAGAAQPAAFVESVGNDIELQVDFTQQLKLSSNVHGVGDSIVSVYGVELMLFGVHMDRTFICVCVNPADTLVLNMLRKASAKRKLVYVFSNPDGKAVRISQQFSLPSELEESLQLAQETSVSGEKFFAAYSLFVMTGGSKELAASRSQQRYPLKYVVDALVDPFGGEKPATDSVGRGPGSCVTMH